MARNAPLLLLPSLDENHIGSANMTLHFLVSNFVRGTDYNE